MKKSTVTRALAFAVALCAVFMLVACRGGKESSTVPAVKHRVSFDSFGGSSVASQMITEGEAVQKPADPTKTGYTFDCWMYGGEEYDFSSPVTKAFTLTATWFDASNVYRVTTGVERAIGNRGTAEIVGQDLTSARFAEGTSVTLKATAFEGYAFAGWVDNLSGELVSTEAQYTFKLRGEVELKATFVCVAIGTDNPTNKAFLDSLFATELNEGQFVVSQKSVFGSVTKTMQTEISFNRMQGLANVVVSLTVESGSEATTTVLYNLWMESKDGAYNVYTYNKNEFVKTQMSQQVADLITDMLGNEVDPEQRDQAILTVYNMFRDSLTQTGNGFDYSISVGEYLLQLKGEYEASKDLHVKQYLHSSVNPVWQAVVERLGSFELAPGVVIDLNTLSVKGWIETLALLSKVDMKLMVASFEQMYVSAVDTVAAIYKADGVEFSEEDRQALMSLYNDVLKLTVSQAIARLNTSVTFGTASEVSESASLPFVLAYSTLSNLTVSEMYSLAFRSMNLSGTAWDITANQSFDACSVSGSFTVTDGAVSAFELCLVENGGTAEITASFSSSCSLVFPA